MFALASMNKKLAATPICVPIAFEFRSRVSISSESQSKKSSGWRFAVMRSQSGRWRTRRCGGIVAVSLLCTMGIW